MQRMKSLFNRQEAGDKEFERLCQHGDEAFQFRNYHQAIEDFTSALNIKPTAKLYCARGDAFYALEYIDLAVQDYEVAHKMEPDNKRIKEKLNKSCEIYTHMKSCASCKELKLYAEAVWSMTQAIRLYPDNSSLYYYRGLIYYDMGSYDKAISDFDRALLKSKHCDYYFSRAKAKEKRFGYAVALQDYFDARTINYRNRPDVEERIAHCYYHLKEYNDAIEIFTRLIVRDANNKELYSYYFCRAMSYMQTSKHHEAIEDFKKVISLDPTLVETYVQLSFAYANISDSKNALQAILGAYILDPYFYNVKIIIKQYLKKFDEINEIMDVIGMFSVDVLFKLVDEIADKKSFLGRAIREWCPNDFICSSDDKIDLALSDFYKIKKAGQFINEQRNNPVSFFYKSITPRDVCVLVASNAADNLEPELAQRVARETISRL